MTSHAWNAASLDPGIVGPTGVARVTVRVVADTDDSVAVLVEMGWLSYPSSMAEGGAHPQSDQLQLAVEGAIGAFAEAHAAFERMESTHDPSEYEQVAARLRILGDMLSNVRQEALTYRLHVAQRRARF